MIKVKRNAAIKKRTYTQMISLRLNVDVLEAIDKAAEKDKRNRSNMIALILEEYVK